MKISQAILCLALSVAFIYTEWKLGLDFKGHRLPTVASLLTDKSPCMETCRQFYCFSQVTDCLTMSHTVY